MFIKGCSCFIPPLDPSNTLSAHLIGVSQQLSNILESFDPLKDPEVSVNQNKKRFSIKDKVSSIRSPFFMLLFFIFYFIFF